MTDEPKPSPESSLPESAEPEPKQTKSKQTKSKQPESAKPELKQTESKQPESAEPELQQAESKQPESPKPESTTSEDTSPPTSESTASQDTPPPTPEAPEQPPEPFTFVARDDEKKRSVVNPFVWGTGRRKASVARVRIRPGDGKFLINKREVDKFFSLDKDRASARKPLNVTDTLTSVDVFVNVGGGGTTGQAGAVLLGLARALAKANPTCEPKLREHKLLHRDPRRVERKKYGQRGARRRFQFSKR